MRMSFPRPSGEAHTFFNRADKAGAELLCLQCGEYEAYTGAWPPPPLRLDCQALVQAQMLRFGFAWFGSLDNNGFKGLIQQFRIGHICARHDHRQRSAVAFRQKALFRAIFGSIRRIWANVIATQTRLAHRSINSLPFPIDQAQFVARFYQQGPDARKQTDGNPTLKRAVNGGVIPVHTRDVIPLTTRAHAKDQRIDHIAWVHPGSAGLFWRIHFQNERFDALP